MQNKFLLKTTVLSLLSCLSISNVSAQDAVVFGGVDVTEKSTATYIGGTKALDGNIFTNGVVIGGSLTGAKYDYDTSAVAENKVNADLTAFNALIGYQWVKEGHSVALYTGLDYQDHSLSPDDPLSKVKGDETGAMVQLEVTKFNSPVDAGFIAKASSTYSSYWVRGRLGNKAGKAKIGAELTTSGNDSYDNNRYGLYATLPVSAKTSLDFAVGNSNIQGKNSVQDSDSAYGSIGFVTLF